MRQFHTKHFFVIGFFFVCSFFLITVSFYVYGYYSTRISDTEFDFLEEETTEMPSTSYEEIYKDWERAPGPPRVGLQVGHWKNNEVPEELERIRNNGGASGGGKAEWEVNHSIVLETVKLLSSQGIIVDILPAVVPPDYLSDLFVAIHADGSTDKNISGFKVASPRRDMTGQGSTLVSIFERTYQAATKMEIDPNVTRNMRGYYAFNWRRLEHSIHPMTPGIIIETGFLTSQKDQKILIYSPSIAAKGIADGIMEFLYMSLPKESWQSNPKIIF